jgi:hypothetical protein
MMEESGPARLAYAAATSTKNPNCRAEQGPATQVSKAKAFEAGFVLSSPKFEHFDSHSFCVDRILLWVLLSTILEANSPRRVPGPNGFHWGFYCLLASSSSCSAQTLQFLAPYLFNNHSKGIFVHLPTR